MRERRGITLIEVLVAIFVMSIGLLGLLALFLAGALQMRDSIRDARTAHAAANAAAIAQFMNVRQDNLVTAQFASSAIVYCDPFGKISSLGNLGSIPRCNFTSPTTGVGLATAEAVRWCSLLDGIDFDANGVPRLYGSEIRRDARYSWAYMLRRPQVADATQVELSVVVYDGRGKKDLSIEPLYASATGATVTFTRGSRNVSIAAYGNGGRPSIDRGSWVLDATNGYFYRVVEVIDTSATAMQLELQTPARFDSTALVVMEKVVEVFERGTGRY